MDHVNKTVNLVSCYYYNAFLPTASTCDNTVSVGSLSAGNYNLNYTVFVTYLSMNVCKTPHDTIVKMYPFYAGPTANTEWMLDNTLELYPNPAEDYFKIEVGDNSVVRKVEILNVNGDRVMEVLEPELISEINISALAKGLYLVRVHTNKYPLIKKIVKE